MFIKIHSYLRKVLFRFIETTFQSATTDVLCLHHKYRSLYYYVIHISINFKRMRYFNNVSHPLIVCVQAHVL